MPCDSYRQLHLIAVHSEDTVSANIPPACELKIIVTSNMDCHEYIESYQVYSRDTFPSLSICNLHETQLSSQ